MPEPDKLAQKIFELMIANKATDRDGTMAICTALVIALIDAGVCRGCAHEMLDATWALIEPSLNEFSARVKH